MKRKKKLYYFIEKIKKTNKVNLTHNINVKYDVLNKIYDK